MRRREFLRAGAGIAGVGTGTSIPVGRAGRSDRDVAAEPFEPLGSLDVEGAKDLVADDGGEVAYVAATDGFVAVDLSEPSEPSILAERRGILADREDGPLEQVWDLWPDGDRLAVVGPAQRLPGADLAGAVLYDVSDPETPERLDFHRLEEGFVHNAFFEDGVVYLAGNGIEGEPVVMLDAGGDELARAGRWSILDRDDRWRAVPRGNRQLHDLYVQDGIAYLAYWDAGTWMLDVSDPAAPEYLGHVARRDPEEIAALSSTEQRREVWVPPGNDHYVQVDEDGDLLGVGREAWAVETEEGTVGGARGVDLYDVSDPADPAHLATVEPPASRDQTRNGRFTTAHNFDLVGDRLYTSWYFGGIRIHDVSDPEEPAELAWWREPSEAVFWTARSAVPGETVVASSAEEGGGFESSVPGRLYVFPDGAGEQSDPPSLTDPPGEERPGVEGRNEPAGTSGGSSASGENESAGGDGPAGASGPDGNGAAPTPGFGAAAGLAGLGVATWRLLRARSGSSR